MDEDSLPAGMDSFFIGHHLSYSLLKKGPPWFMGIPYPKDGG
jgi:hypothetical protein